MISWRSFTTSKVLPTFVGESGTSVSYSYTATTPRKEPTGTNEAGLAGKESLKASATINRTQTKEIWASGETNSFWNSTGGVAVSIGRGGLSSERSVTENTTWTRKNEYVPDGAGETRQATPSSASSPLATARQESTKTESYESGYRTTKTISAYEDEEGNEGEPLVGYKWTTTVTGAGTNAKTTFTEITAQTTETVEDYKTRQGQRTVVTTTGADVLFKTYTAIDGNVELIAHTIYELNAGTFAATVGASAEMAVTALSFTQGRFTRSFAEYMEPLTFVVDRDAFTSKTTKTTTAKSGVDTTRVKFTQETWKQWFVSYEYQDGCDPQREIYRTTVYSSPYNHFKTEEEATQTNGSETTFETLSSFDTTTSLSKKFNFTGLRLDCTTQVDTGNRKQITRTRTVTNTFEAETTTFSISGEVTRTSTANHPGYIDAWRFPWKSYGDGAKRLFTITNQATVFYETTIETVPETTVNIDANFEVTATYAPFGQGIPTEAGSDTNAITIQDIKEGEFFRRVVGFSTRRNNATVIRAASLLGIADQNLSFQTTNNHSTVGILMTHNAQHTWAGLEGQIEAGSISRGVVGAIPLYPTFSGVMSEGAGGWELCDSSEYTTVVGSRVGQNFSTTIAWQTIEGSSTINTTESGTFTLNSSSSVLFGVATGFSVVQPWGGFFTPNASRTVYISPGAVLLTTYDKNGFGTLSTSYSAGTTYQTAPVGPVPVTMSSFIQLGQGYGVFTQTLLDNGLP